MQPVIEVWLVPLEGTPDSDELGALSAPERLEAQRLRTIAARAGYVRSHFALRALLGSALGLPLPEVALARECLRCGSTEHGRIVVPGSNIAVSVSRRRGLALIALASAMGPIGIDCEPRDALKDWREIESALAPAEHSSLSALPAPEAKAIELWCLKEAASKASGLGVYLSFRDLECQNEADARYAVHDRTAGRTWHAQVLDLGNQYIGALAAQTAFAVRLSHRRSFGARPEVVDLPGHVSAMK